MRARQLLENIREEGEKQLNYEKRQLESRINGIEEATRSQKSRNDDLIRRIEDCERTSNTKINEMRNQIYFLREQFGREKQDDKKNSMILSELGRQLGEVNKEYSRLQVEDNMIRRKKDSLEADRRTDLESIKSGVIGEEKRLQEHIISVRRQEQEIDDRINKKKKEIAAAKSENDRVLAKMQEGLEGTMGRYK